MARSRTANTVVATAPPVVEETRSRAWLAALFATLGLISCALAIIEFRSLRNVSYVDIPLSATEWRAEGDLVVGRVTQGMPRFYLWWDGEPPQATLVAAQNGAVIAPSLIIENSLSLNSRGVLWLNDKECRFVLDRPTFNSLGVQGISLRFEKLPSRWKFYFFTFGVIACVLAALLSALLVRLFNAAPAKKWNVFWDNARILTFVIISLASVLVFYPGHPVANMSGDPANIHSFAAGLSAPRDFERDAVLSDPRNYAWYTPLYVKTVQLFGWLGFHYATSRAFLCLISTLAGLFGYYRLFRLISRSAIYAFCATLGLWFLKAHYPPNENWGAMLVLPRTVYGAFLPWVAWLALKLLTRPSLWWVAAAASGLLFYVHPVSSPALTGALLTGYVWGGRSPWWQRLIWGFFGAVAALAVMFPYVLIYMHKYQGTVVEDQELVSQAFDIARERFAPGYLEPLVFYRDLGLFLVTTPRYWFGIAGLAALMWYRRRAWGTRLAVGYTLGFVIVTCLIPTADVIVAQQMGRLPFQIDLIRNLRYLDVWLIGIIGTCLREFDRPGQLRDWRLDIHIAATRWLGERLVQWSLPLTCALVWTTVCYLPSICRSTYRMAEFSYDNLTILVGKPRGELAEQIEAFRAVHELRGPREVVGGTFHLRQIHVPVAYNDKDLGILAYSNPQQLVDAKNTLKTAADSLHWPLSEEAALRQAAILNAELLLVDRPHVTTALVRSPRTIFQNNSQILIRVSSREIAALRNQPPQSWAAAPQFHGFR